VPDTAKMTSSFVFELPSLGADMESGTVLEWYVHLGDQVRKGDVIALVSTEKADIEVEIWHPGQVAELLVEAGVEVGVGTPLLRLDRIGARPDVRSATGTDRPPSIGGRPLSSPLARTLAAERGLDLGAIRGSGPHDAIVARDLPAPAPPSSGPSPLTRRVEPADLRLAMRRTIATRMETANREIPHYHLDLDVDVSSTLARLEHRNRNRPIADRVLPAAVFLRAAALAAVRVPELNGHWIDGGFQPAAAVDLGVVISLRQGGLVTPTIAQADSLDLDQMMTALRTMVAGARTRALRSSWMGEASLTVTNLGDNGADRVSGVIFPPQVALVGFGRVRERPWVIEGGAVSARPILTVTLAADHRATDGVTGSRYLEALARALTDTTTTTTTTTADTNSLVIDPIQREEQ
jgi:pyruvate dehydrogenase E2 component (dihydrolipoamide acetyltransferase)